MINELDCSFIRERYGNLIHWWIVRGQKLNKHVLLLVQKPELALQHFIKFYGLTMLYKQCIYLTKEGTPFRWMNCTVIVVDLKPRDLGCCFCIREWPGICKCYSVNFSPMSDSLKKQKACFRHFCLKSETAQKSIQKPKWKGLLSHSCFR